jgi:hypothetical protein
MHNAAGQISVTFQNTRQLRILTTCIFLFATLLTNAQTITLDFEPSKPVIRFYFDSLTITATRLLFFMFINISERKDLKSMINE